MKRIAFLILVANALLTATAGISLCKVLVESQENPVGVFNDKPRFSWQISSNDRGVVQTAYQITVASSPNGALNGKNNVIWNSGKVISPKMVNIYYDGPALESRKLYYWSLKVWTNRGEAKSKVQHWSMALLNQNDWHAKWIGVNDPESVSYDSTRVIFPARYLRKEFNLNSNIKRATLYCSAGGSMVWYINGNRVSTDVLAPLDSWFPESINALTYDVTSFINAHDDNAIGCLLGNGRFMGLRHETRLHFGLPCAIAQLEIEHLDGSVTTIITDQSWSATNRGPVRNNSEFDGETYDAHLQLGDWTLPHYSTTPVWKPCDIMPVPTKQLIAQMSPSQTINEELKPQRIWQDVNGNYIVDMGQNFAGWTRFTFHARKDSPVSIHYAESLKDGGNEIYDANMRLAQTIDTYIPDRDGTVTWEPQLVYHGGRYLEIKGLDYQPSVDDFTACVIHDRMSRTGHFSSSSNILNRIHEAAYWGVRSNYHGMPVDCPQRDEKQGWLGDHATGCYGESFLLTNNLLYNKWARDIEESQGPNGEVSDVVPRLWTLYNHNVEWPCTYIYCVDMLYTRYGDDYAIRHRYDSMKRWVQWVKNNIFDDDLISGFYYGDWCVPPESPELIHSKDPSRKTDGTLIGSAIFYDLLGKMAKFARLLGRYDDAAQYNATRAAMFTAYNKKYFNTEHGYYSTNTPTANLLSIDVGLVPNDQVERVMKNAADVTLGPQWNGHVSGGVIAVQHLMRGFSRNGYEDLALHIATNETYPSWGYMINNGATTIWELWNGDTADPAMNSGNHIMLLGDLVIWMYEDIAGIHNEHGATGYDRILLQPTFPSGLTHADASYESVHGTIKSNWTLNGNQLAYSVTIPAGTTARIVLPTRFGIKPKIGNGIYNVTTDGNNTIIAIGSGNYTFSSARHHTRLAL